MKSYWRNPKTGRPIDFKSPKSAHIRAARVVRSGAKRRYKLVRAGGGYARVVFYSGRKKKSHY